MKRFDLEAAKRGEPIVCRDGTPARFIAHDPEGAEEYRVLVRIRDRLCTHEYMEDGHRYNDCCDEKDLFMAEPPKTTLEEIRAAQLREYPDSKFVTVIEAFDWANQIPFWLEGEYAEKKKEELKTLYGEDWRWEFSNYVEKERLKYANQILRGIAVALANAYEQGDPIQFYECGLQEDGTYKWKGCRFGVEGQEYYSGFSA